MLLDGLQRMFVVDLHHLITFLNTNTCNGEVGSVRSSRQSQDHENRAEGEKSSAHGML